MRKFLDVQYSSYDETLVDIYLPDEGKSGFRTIVNFHGGGLDHGSKASATMDELAAAFTSAGYAFASVEYRKYPGAKFPDFLVDCAKATAFVQNFVKDYGANDELIISGQSAGAWLSLMLCLNKTYLANEGINAEDVKGWFIDMFLLIFPLIPLALCMFPMTPEAILWSVMLMQRSWSMLLLLSLS